MRCLFSMTTAKVCMHGCLRNTCEDLGCHVLKRLLLLMVGQGVDLGLLMPVAAGEDKLCLLASAAGFGTVAN